MKNEYLEAGEVVSAHGVRGGLKIKHYCDRATVLSKQKTVYIRTEEGYLPREVLSASAADSLVIMCIEGITTREAAIAKRGMKIYLHRDSIPLKKGDMFIADMIGLAVTDARSGACYGKLEDVSDVAGRRIYTVLTDKGERVLLPDVPEFIKEISPEGGMRITPISGFFDEADEV